MDLKNSSDTLKCRCRFYIAPHNTQCEPCSSSLRIPIVIRSHLQGPEIALHRALAAGGVLLCLVGCLVSRNLADILCTGVYCAGDSTEAQTLLYLRGLDRRRAFHFLAHEEAVTVAAGRLGHAAASWCKSAGRSCSACSMLRIRYRYRCSNLLLPYSKNDLKLIKSLVQ